uniref:Uncharacterized protein n=1 Tax=Marseillevirus LCMAC101 TaxID=2506602 RepID=A0A481YRU4_9VIRU|nr:MAG: hypothetical protein LCMAC101_00220 [Marseillevirus LCMAC101]
MDEISLVDFIGKILIEPQVPVPLSETILEDIDETEPGFFPFSWGSCQYDTACDMFQVMDLLQTNGYNPFEVLKIDDFDVLTPSTDDIIRTVEKFVTAVSKHIEECYPEEEYREEREEKLDKLEELKLESTTLNSVFKTAQDNSWDLWTISLTICSHVYGEEYEEYLKENTGKSPGFGPMFNILVQSQNYVVGAICYRLYADGLVTNPHTTYKGFDT